MRQDEQQADTGHPEAVRSAPVPVPPPGDRSDRTDVPEDALDDRGTFDDPRAAGERDTTGGGQGDRDRRAGTADEEDRPEFHEPGPVPSAFGATTVGGAVAASALASGRPEDEPDPRTESTAQPGDGAEGERVGWRADPTAEFRGGPGWEERRQAREAGGDEEGAPTTVLPPDATEGRPERRGDLSTWGGDPDAAAAGAAGYGSATPSMVDPDAVSPDADPTRTSGAVAASAVGAGAGTAAALEAAGTARPAGSTVAAEPAKMFDPGTAQSFRDRWRDVQLRFVDDPRAAAGEAQSLVDEAIQALASGLAAQKQKLGTWQDAGSADTEQLRVAVRQYRDFLDRVLGR